MTEDQAEGPPCKEMEALSAPERTPEESGSQPEPRMTQESQETQIPPEPQPGLETDNPLPEMLWHGWFFFFYAALIVTITLVVASGYMVTSMLVVCGILPVVYVTLRILTGRLSLSPSDFVETLRGAVSSDAVIDAAFVTFLLLTFVIALTISQWYTVWMKTFIGVAICTCLYAIVRMPTNHLHIISAAESAKRNQQLWLVLCGLLMTAIGIVLCIAEYDVAHKSMASSYNALAPSTLAIGVLNLGAALARPTRATNFVFAWINASLSILVMFVTLSEPGYSYYKPMTEDLDYMNLMQSSINFLDVDFLLKVNLRVICFPLILTTSLSVAIALASSIVSFSQKSNETCKTREFQFAKFVLASLGALLMGLCILKIWCMSTTFAMPTLTDDWSYLDPIHISSSISSLSGFWTALLALSHLRMRCMSKLEMVLIMLLAVTAMTSDYYTLKTFNPDFKLEQLDEKLGDFTGCRGEGKEAHSFCYQVKPLNGAEEETIECLHLTAFCDGIIDIKHKTRALTNCDPELEELYMWQNHYNKDYFYDRGWCTMASDEAFCRQHYEKYVSFWKYFVACCMAVCGAVILLTAFLRTGKNQCLVGKLRAENQITNWQRLRNEEGESAAGQAKEDWGRNTVIV